MTDIEFDEIFEDFVDKMHHVLSSRAELYASDDRLNNFKKAATVLNRHPLEVLTTLVSKHFCALCDEIDRIVYEDKEPDMTLINSLAVDIANYCGPLVIALVKETKEKKDDDTSR